MRACVRRRLIAAVLFAAASATAHAEKADRDKPTLLECAKLTTDELKQVSICSGDAVLTRGTLRISGGRMEVRQDPEGYRSVVITAASGQLASFRQRRDATRPGLEEWIEGYAERIEYDERSDVVKFIQRAQWKRLENGQPRDEVAGQQITYNSRSATYSVESGTAADGDGRVRMILAPRDDERGTGAKPGAPPALKPAPAAGTPAEAGKK